MLVLKFTLTAIRTREFYRTWAILSFGLIIVTPAIAGLYNFDRIIYRYYQDNAVALEAFKAGEFDFYVLSLSWSPSFCEAASERGNSGRARSPHSVTSGGIAARRTAACGPARRTGRSCRSATTS